MVQAIQERHENFLLKSEIDKLREENETLRGIMNKSCCPNCGIATINSSEASMPPEEHQLRVENAKLKSEVRIIKSFLSHLLSSHTTNDHSSLIR